ILIKMLAQAAFSNIHAQLADVVLRCLADAKLDPSGPVGMPRQVAELQRHARIIDVIERPGLFRSLTPLRFLPSALIPPPYDCPAFRAAPAAGAKVVAASWAMPLTRSKFPHD